ncbi:MAG TPA: hypothetical protein PLY72_06690 [Candidatus Obscuribacter sp.]|nr:hypothetical protein [Candidatus Obscuribacter sp.]
MLTDVLIDLAGRIFSGWEGRVVLALSLTLTVPAFAASPTTDAVLKPIDPSAAQLDTPPAPEPAPGSTGGANPFNSNIQGQPLGRGDKAGFGGSGLNMETPQEDASPQDELRIAGLEQKAFGTTYNEHEVVDRLDHLEKEVFGSAKTGSLAERLGRLETKLLGGSAFGAGAGRPMQPPPPVQGFPPQQLPPQGGSGMNQGQYRPPVNSPPPYREPQPYNQGSQGNQGNYQPPNQRPSYPPSGYQQPGFPQGNFPQGNFPPQNQGGNNSQYQNYGQPPVSYQNQIPPPVQRPPANFAPFPPGNPQGNPPGNQMGFPPGAPQAVGGFSLDASMVIAGLPYDPVVGDYLPAIRKFPGAGGGISYAQWRKFPVRVRVPQGSPDSWNRSIEAVIARWGQYVPVKIALPKEDANAEIIWVNTLPKGLLGVTRFGIKDGQMRTWVYLLRPSFYPPEIPERSLSPVFMREMGHVLGLLGKSDKNSDIMYQAESTAAKAPSKTAPPAAARAQASLVNLKIAPISTRDINTLKRIYQSPPLPDNLTLNEPMEWATSY